MFRCTRVNWQPIFKSFSTSKLCLKNLDRITTEVDDEKSLGETNVPKTLLIDGTPMVVRAYHATTKSNLKGYKEDCNHSH